MLVRLRARTQELERQQPGVEWELRRLLEKPGKRLQAILLNVRSVATSPAADIPQLAVTDHLKSAEEQRLEKKLMQRLVEIVDGRNAIVEGLDEDRLR